MSVGGRPEIYDARFMGSSSSDVSSWDEYAAIDAALDPIYPGLGWRHHPIGKAILTDGAVLDFGCGTGRFRPFFDGVRRYVGLDQSLEAVRLAIARWAGDPKAVFVHCPGIAGGRRIPYANGYFDLVFTCGVLQQMQDSDLSAVLKEARRVVRDGARFVAYEATVGAAWPRDIDFPPHGRAVEGWRAAFEPHGFSPVSQEDGLHVFTAVSEDGRAGETGEPTAG